jgi:hypothetical protein
MTLRAQSPDELPRVSRFEADLLTILQGFLGHVPRSQVLPLLARSCERTKCLSRTAIDLVQDTLAKGATLLVAQEGWREERFLRREQAISGRVWERTPPGELGLAFSPQALDFLMWATAAPLDRNEAAWQPAAELALGDRWLLTMAYETVRLTDIGRLWTGRQPWRSEPLCQLLFAGDFEHGTRAAPLDFTPWLSPAGVAFLEAWQTRLAARWIEMELAKSTATSAEQLRAIGRSQERVLSAFLDAIDRVGRRDLARFLLVGLRQILKGGPALRQWVGESLLTGLRLADRQATYRDALALVAASERLVAWQSQARGTGYFDEGYHAAQLWKSDWEAYNGERTCALARGLLDQTAWV